MPWCLFYLSIGPSVHLFFPPWIHSTDWKFYPNHKAHSRFFPLHVCDTLLPQEESRSHYQEFADQESCKQSPAAHAPTQTSCSPPHQFQVSATELSVQTAALPLSLWNRAGCHRNPFGKKSSPTQLHCTHQAAAPAASPSTWVLPVLCLGSTALCQGARMSPHSSPLRTLDAHGPQWGRQLG